MLSSKPKSKQLQSKTVEARINKEIAQHIGKRWGGAINWRWVLYDYMIIVDVILAPAILRYSDMIPYRTVGQRRSIRNADSQIHSQIATNKQPLNVCWTKLSNTVARCSFWVRFSKMCSPFSQTDWKNNFPKWYRNKETPKRLDLIDVPIV